MLNITSNVFLDPAEIKLTFVRSSGPGGQNVNKVATKAQLRFNVLRSSLPEDFRIRFISIFGKKMTQSGEIIISANRYRTQERNKRDAIERLLEMLKKASITPKKRKKTKPNKTVKEKRLKQKKLISRKKSLRREKVEH